MIYYPDNIGRGMDLIPITKSPIDSARGIGHCHLSRAKEYMNVPKCNKSRKNKNTEQELTSIVISKTNSGLVVIVSSQSQLQLQSQNIKIK